MYGIDQTSEAVSLSELNIQVNVRSTGAAFLGETDSSDPWQSRADVIIQEDEKGFYACSTSSKVTIPTPAGLLAVGCPAL
jgi:hypothetical protein